MFADPGKIEQVIVNLVNHAYKYARESKQVEIRIEETEVEFTVRVIDQGKGIPEEQLKYLFDRYYKAENKSGDYSGMGLGLFICASIIKAHNGQIGVESVIDTGSTFWFTLPK